LNKEDIPSRAYIQFNNAEQISIFSKEYDGHVFRDKQGDLSPSWIARVTDTSSGKESYAVVEFAPFQKIPPPKERVKIDSRVGTIEKGLAVPTVLYNCFIPFQTKITSHSYSL
jgi:regulator of nonsense transcripts 3